LTVKIAALLTGSAFLRRHLFAVIDRKAKRQGEQKAQPFVPERASADQRQIIHNILVAVERWMAGAAVSRTHRERMITSFSRIFNSEPDVRQGFRETHGFGPPAFLTLSPTMKCNLKCAGCYASSSAELSPTLEFDVVDRIVQEQEDLWGSHFTVLSGGEPLMYRSHGKGVLDLARRHPDMFFLMYTNGTLIDEKTAAEMAKLGNITPAISVEGYERETDERRGKGTYRRILRAFQNLQRAGVLFGISVTATKHNCETILSDDFVENYFARERASYMWVFQYMPIGRGSEPDLMVSPEQRLTMFRRTQVLMYEQELFVADFWNSATLSNGCIAAGKFNGNGYIYINWNGDVTPCVFVPYSSSNIVQIYDSSGDLNDAITSPLMNRVRQWQQNYLAGDTPQACGNMLAPCPIRDHHGELRRIIDDTGARPIDEAAEQALHDDRYYNAMCSYGELIGRQTGPIWCGEYCGLQYTERQWGRSAEYAGTRYMNN
jgi:MoaA/NifB/PqqE/SkfB family radical SAM enzyme